MCSNRIAALALAGVMVLGLVACSPTDPEPTDTSTPEVTEPADTSMPEETEPQETVEPTDDTEPVEPTTTEIPDLFTSVNETVYATTTVNIREGFSADTDKVGSLGRGQSVKRVGIGTGDAEGWSQVEFNGQTAYISSDYLSLTKPAAQSSGSNSSGSNNSGGQTSQSKPSGSGGQTQTQQPSSQPSGGNQTTQQPSSSGSQQGSSGWNTSINDNRPTDLIEPNTPDMSDDEWDRFIESVGDAVSD